MTAARHLSKFNPCRDMIPLLFRSVFVVYSVNSLLKDQRSKAYLLPRAVEHNVALGQQHHIIKEVKCIPPAGGRGTQCCPGTAPDRLSKIKSSPPLEGLERQCCPGTSAGQFLQVQKLTSSRGPWNTMFPWDSSITSSKRL